MTINPTDAPEKVTKFHADTIKAFVGKSVWIVDKHQERTSNGNINRTLITICDEEGFGSVTLQDGGDIRHVGAFNAAFGSTIDDVRFSKWSDGVYRFWLWNDTHRDVAEFYYYC